jgi:Pectate lyase superfamily protein
MRKILFVVVLAVVGVWIALRKPSPGPTTVLNLRNFGAVGNGIADDGPALQRALDALATAGGGTLHVPPGTYAIATPVARGFSGKASAIAITGERSSTAIDVAGNGTGLNLTSEFIVKVGKERDALALGGLETLLLRDIAFAGIKDVRDDAHVVLQVSDIERARIEHCEFYGLSSLTAGGSIVAASRSGLNVDRTAFLGCATNSAHSASMIQNLTWKDIAITNTKFIDYGQRPDSYSKTPMGSPYSWIGIGDAEDVESGSSRRDAVIRNVFLDEGALIGITARPDLHGPSSTQFNVFISAIRMNVSNLAACGIYLSGADKVLIEQSHLGWSHNAAAAIILKNVNDAILDRVECAAHANTIRADGDTKRLVIINSTYQTLDSAAPYTKKITTADDPVQFVRQQFMDVLGAQPALREVHVWSDRMLRCDGSAPCLAERRAELGKYLKSGRKAVAR